jgi:tripeptidyl-peptidase-1
MKTWQSLAWLCLLGRVALGKTGFKNFESVHEMPEGWEVVGSPDADMKLRFTIALAPVSSQRESYYPLNRPQSHMKTSGLHLIERILFGRADLEQEKQGGLEETLRKVSDPKSPQYGLYLGKEEVDALLTPSPAGVKAVLNWLNQSTIQETDIRLHGQWIDFLATPQQADNMMDANFLIYQSLVDNNISSVRTRQVSLPQDVIPYVNMIHPTTYFTPVKPHQPEIQSFRVDTTTEPDASCNTKITPKCLRDLYRIRGVTPNPKTSGFIGVAGFLGEYPAQSDLTQFLEELSEAGRGASYTSSTLLGKICLRLACLLSIS